MGSVIEQGLAVASGIFIFSESPDVMTLLGSLLVVISGVYTLSQTRKKVSSRVVNSEA